MRVLESIVSQKTGNGRMSDKELAERVLQYVPDVYSTTTLRVLCASTRYLSSIDVLEHFSTWTRKSCSLPIHVRSYFF